ncbi:MAG: HAMP domain-containing histidine kinase, partial [Candidatus Heimdallarchaeota archaeon]|nr:HAMP domain-containing histidine kinase [Candidatus Heimdallarchaeota archaeon]MCK4955940.1 HAMP domain-containing histidine kinase [Candidatus Heimdallarchaeota archaeon]
TSLQSIVSHDATNYLSTAISFIDVAIDNESTEFMEKALNPIEKTIILLDSTSNLTKQFMDYSKKKEKLSSIVKQICFDLEQDKESYGIKKVDFNITVEDISLDSHPLITGVIKNILENALKYASGDEARIDITSTITQTKNLEMLNLIFEDYGQGINPTRRKKLLKQPVDSKKGHGFGLFIYNFLIDKILGGSISLEERVRDDYKKGTRMIVSIPLEQ